MAKTLLNGVNGVLKKARALDSQGELSTLTDSARQMFIDTAIQAINEVTDELYTLADLSLPKQLKEATITLVTNQQAYALKSDLILLRREYHMIDEANSQTITILGEDGYWRIIQGDLQQDDTGLPHWAVIRPTDGRLFFDRKPDAASNGNVYKYRYDRDLEFDEACDVFPFSDMVFRAVVPAAAELYRFYQQQEFVKTVFDAAMGRAAALLRRVPKRTTWAPRRGGDNITDPMNDSPLS